MTEQPEKQTPYERHKPERQARQTKYYHTICKPNRLIEKKNKFVKAEKKYLINEFVFSVSD